MAEASFFIREGDTASDLTDTLKDADGVAVNISGATVALQLVPVVGGAAIVDGAATNAQDGGGLTGAVSYSWGAGETDTPGFYLGSWIVTFAGGDIQTYPNAGYILVHITPDAPTSVEQDYIAAEELKATLELTGTTFANADIPLAITSASRAIDEITGRRFYADTDANQVRYYSPEHLCRLKIDDVITLTELATDPNGTGAFDDVWTENTDFVLEPLNAVAEGRPRHLIRVHPRGGFLLPCVYPRSVRVTAKFGWASVPSGAKTATMMVATRLFKRARGEAVFGVTGFDAAGAAVRIARSDPDVSLALRGYMKDSPFA